MSTLRNVPDAMWGLEEQLHEDWKDLIDDITVKECHNQTYLVLSPTDEFLVYSPVLHSSGVMWVSRTLKEYQEESI